ncbi:MAG: acyl-CoA desaturase [Planctomycetota bacterium]
MATETKPESNPPEPPKKDKNDPEYVVRMSELDDQAKDIHVGDGKRDKRIPRPEMVDEKSRVIWEYVIPVVAFHLLIPLAFIPYCFSWWGVIFLPIGNYIFTSMGIGAGYHRLLTHRGFTCPKWFEYFLATLGVCSFQDSPARWVLVHRVHHQHSDHQPDPHTPRVSAFWAHMGWMFIDNRALSTASAYDKYVRDLMRDPYYMWLTRGANSTIVYVVSSIAITLTGGAIGWFATGTTAGLLQYMATWFMWGVIMRTLFTWHVTWAINSASHMWGYRNYETREDSTNNWLFALLTNGEGWHNNHHADPRSAQHGHRWWEIDITYWTLCALEKIGLIKNLVRPNQSALDRKSV